MLAYHVPEKASNSFSVGTFADNISESIHPIVNCLKRHYASVTNNAQQLSLYTSGLLVILKYMTIEVHRKVNVVLNFRQPLFVVWLGNLTYASKPRETLRGGQISCPVTPIGMKFLQKLHLPMYKMVQTPSTTGLIMTVVHDFRLS